MTFLCFSSISPAFISPERRPFVDDTHIEDLQHAVYITNPRKKQNWKTFVLPFMPDSWIGVGILILTCAVALTVSGYFMEGKEQEV